MKPARRLLTTHAPHIERQLNEFDQLATEIRHRSQVITHGEPHPGNFIRTRTGLKLIDWETVRLAPPERDLWMLDTLDAYTEITGYVADSAGLSYYRLRWRLTDIAIFVRELRGPHQATQDITDSWTYLNSYFD
ncbi:phosphotransferase [Acrocarpospora sp. B8E8]|uniref:phosphotransferase n=1 Tax=Acrocarpospora sp. B8E8 TaxID=3153572 RepID=UPI00325D1702